ncbi:MAG: hypothetical protein NT007_06325 [Candidatus Kapabacteria bacterium]|nr:hypothetical protein [Candidatus Kapabacteria bacterium]
MKTSKQGQDWINPQTSSDSSISNHDMFFINNKTGWLACENSLNHSDSSIKQLIQV